MPLTPSHNDPNRKEELKRRSQDPDSFNDPQHAASGGGQPRRRGGNGGQE
jgi:hypothetical protein